jgi:hypothetical protein
MASIFFPLIDNGQGDIKANFLICLTEAFKGRDVQIQRYSDSLVPRSRNRAAAAFLRGKWDYMLFIDCDIVFSKDQIDMLMESDEPIVAGIYCKKEAEVAPCYNLLDDSANVPVGGLIEIKRAGTGFLRIARVVLERMKENPHAPHWTQAPIYKNHGVDEWDFFPTGVKEHEYLSEDWFFCDRARALGFKVMCDTRIQTKHEGTTFYPTDDAVRRQMEREKAMLSNLSGDGVTAAEGQCGNGLAGAESVTISPVNVTAPPAVAPPAQNIIDPLGLAAPTNN